ncbi:hypothetical protein VNO77_27971 [Canavalia gladiata]|uniref:Uncharacterized protein n=1 Tax=Canavalia gladiata TaxID=3824 RepID=A0AAN9KV14_CANGL
MTQPYQFKSTEDDLRHTTYPSIMPFRLASWVNTYPKTTLGRFGKQQVWNKANKNWNDINSQCLGLFALFSPYLD